MKVSVGISMEEADLQKLKHFSELTGVPVSKLFEDHVRVLVRTYDACGFKGKAKLSKLDVLRLFGKGMAQEV